MNQNKLEEMTINQLVSRFAELGVAQDRALLYSEIAKFNRLFLEMAAVRNELKRRPGDQRRALLTLYNHPNMQVRLQAATVTLAIAPEAARRLIEAIASSRKYPQAGDAGMTLDSLDRGIFVPN
jgi:hypothetical protein